MESDSRARARQLDSPALIGIDVGSTAVRAIAFDVHGRKLAVGSRPTPVRTVATGAEYDPDAIFAVALAALTDVGKDLAGRPVAGIAATSVGESCVLIDDAGRSLAPSIIWHDHRTLPQARAIEAAIGRERIFEITGHAVERIFTLPKLLWMREHWPEAMARARHVLMMADWIAFRLSGVAASEPMLASRTLYFDIRRRQWSEELLALAGVDVDFPAPLMASGTALGPLRDEIRSASGLAGSPVVAVGGHDHVLGAMAAGLTKAATAIDSVGTAEGLMMGAEVPLDDPRTIQCGYIQGAIATERASFYVVGSIFSAGGSLEWLRAIAGGKSQEALIAEAAAVPAGSGGVIFLPHLGNGPPPEPDPHARGAFLGLTAAATPAMLYRAVIEGLALQSRLMLDGLTGLAGVGPAATIRLVGGVTRNRLFTSIKASVFGQPVVVVDEPETTALGAALLAGIAAGIFPAFDAAVAGLDLGETVIEPDASAAFYDEMRTTVFAHVHERLRPINARLQQLMESRT